MKIIPKLLAEYHPSDFSVLEPCDLMEAKGGRVVEQTPGFKKGWKKYGKDARVVSAFKALLTFIETQPGVPPTSSYPPQFNVHLVNPKESSLFPVAQDRVLWCHLKGQKIGMVFSVTPRSIDLLFIGTHQQLGWK